MINCVNSFDAICLKVYVIGYSMISFGMLMIFITTSEFNGAGVDSVVVPCYLLQIGQQFIIV